MSAIPQFYRPPFGLPLYWGDEQSGELRAAVTRYFEFATGATGEPTDNQVALLRDYLEHFINAPCWEPTPFKEELAALRKSVKEISTAQQIREWNDQAMKIALDPF